MSRIEVCMQVQARVNQAVAVQEVQLADQHQLACAASFAQSEGLSFLLTRGATPPKNDVA